MSRASAVEPALDAALGDPLTPAGRRRRSGSARRPRSSSSTPARSFRRTWTILRSVARHRLERDRSRRSASTRAARPVGERLERRPAAVAVAGGVDHDLDSAPRRPRADDRVREILDRVDRLAVLADHEPEVAAGERSRRSPRPASRTSTVARGRARRATCSSNSRTRAARRDGLSVVGRRRARDGRRTLGDHAGRHVADPEQPALALGEDLELDARLVEPGEAPLELAQRRPLGLADGLAGRLGLGRRLRLGVPASRSLIAGRAPFFLRRRTGAAARRRRLRAAGCRLSAPARFGRRPRALASGLLRAASCASRFGARLGDHPPRHEPLAGRPEVRRHPVDHRPTGKLRMNEDEGERQDQEESAASCPASSASAGSR